MYLCKKKEKTAPQMQKIIVCPTCLPAQISYSVWALVIHIGHSSSVVIWTLMLCYLH